MRKNLKYVILFLFITLEIIGGVYKFSLTTNVQAKTPIPPETIYSAPVVGITAEEEEVDIIAEQKKYALEQRRNVANETTVAKDIVQKTVVISTDKTITVPKKTTKESSHAYTVATNHATYSRGGNYNTRTVYVVASFYTSLPEECGGNSHGITASGAKVAAGLVATGKNVPFGTTFIIPELNEYVDVINTNVFTVADRMANWVIEKRKATFSEYGDVIPIDVFVPRKDGESNSQWSKRVNNLGVKLYKAQVIISGS